MLRLAIWQPSGFMRFGQNIIAVILINRNRSLPVSDPSLPMSDPVDLF
jgi:hypothetical protein